jgi:hypothetical protein
MAVIRDGLQREQLWIDLALSSSTTRTTPGLKRRDANAPEYTDRWAAVRCVKLSDFIGELDVFEVETRRAGLFIASIWCGSAEEDSRIRRVYSCAGHKRADATVAACAATPHHGSAGQRAAIGRPAALERDACQQGSRQTRRGMRYRRRSSREGSAAAPNRLLEMEFDIARGQPSAARSGHSRTQDRVRRRYSEKPARSHSSGSLKRYKSK